MKQNLSIQKVIKRIFCSLWSPLRVLYLVIVNCRTIIKYRHCQIPTLMNSFPLPCPRSSWRPTCTSKDWIFSLINNSYNIKKIQLTSSLKCHKYDIYLWVIQFTLQRLKVWKTNNPYPLIHFQKYTFSRNFKNYIIDEF